MKKFLLSLLGGFFVFSLSSQPQITLETFAENFNAPASINHAGDSRLFVVEQSGLIKIVDDQGNVNSAPFLDIEDRVSYGGERGLLGLAFHPDYADNGYFYVNYTGESGNTHISRFSVSNTDPDLADPESENVLLTIEQPYSNHNGGDIRFGPDGLLYISTGDGGSAGDPENRAQDLSELLGKLLRIDVDGGDPYGIPPHNPFVGEPGAKDEIYALGLRNPWRFSFDSETGDLWIADVGQNEYEEVNFEPAGSDGGVNYGWRCYEGNHEYNTQGCQAQDFYTFPVHEYSHAGTGGCSVTGGFVYRGEQYPNLEGHYVFADYCNDKIWTLHNDNGNWELTNQGQYTGNNFATFGEASDGELYVAGFSSGTIYHIVDTTTTGVQGIDKSDRIHAYPNPFSHKITIRVDKEISNAVISLSDMKDEIHYEKPMEGKEHELPTRNLAKGIYLLKIISGKKMFTKKVIKK
ncbi:MAG: PQQ-dependent sugar dehydrogenase [Bacteroidales bacterium]|nr:PQQ-dependent sugar dehydrogenase [Bacteroidales bacterium]MCF8334954.1 PQQ-dependent sugar dehydrogenase [Bacteroidales bacterium]